MKHTDIFRKELFWCLALVQIVMVGARAAETESFDTFYSWPDTEPGLGVECRASIPAAVADIKAKRLEQADQKLSKTLLCFHALMLDADSVYVTVANAAEFAKYQLEYQPSNSAFWIDWGYREAIHLKAFILSANRDFDGALELLQRETDTAPFAAAPHNERGYILGFGLRRLQEALESYRRALSLAREFQSSRNDEPIALRGIGFLLIELNDLDQAESMFKKSLELDPSSNIARNELQYIKQLKRLKR